MPRGNTNSGPVSLKAHRRSEPIVITYYTKINRLVQRLNDRLSFKRLCPGIPETSCREYRAAACFMGLIRADG